MIDIKAQINSFLFGWYDSTTADHKKLLIIRKAGDTFDEDVFDDAYDITYTEYSDNVSGSRFDRVFSLVSPETFAEPHDYIKSCLALLNDSGVLLFVMNNRLGIRYFCGDRDPYTDGIFDGVENYCNVKQTDIGRCYSKSEIKHMLGSAGIDRYALYGIYSGSDYPTHFIAEDYIPREDLANRILPVYHYPKTVFLDEERLYDTLKNDDLIHTLANSYLVEVVKGKVSLSDACYVTMSLGRDKNNAYATIVHRDNTVTKKALYEEGADGIRNIIANQRTLEKRGVDTVDIIETVDNGAVRSIRMPYIEAPTAQKYLQELLLSDKEKFLKEMDHFMSEIDKSADIIEEDKKTGPLAAVAYPDMVPLNTFRVREKYLFFDQEFAVSNYPLNAVKARVLFSFFAFHDELRFVEDELFSRYRLSENKQLFMEMERAFLGKLLSADKFDAFRSSIRRNQPFTDRNRKNMNHPADYHNARFEDIFRGAKNKECYVFGSGVYAKDFIERYGREYEIKYVFDNDQRRWGERLHNIEIVSPDVINGLSQNNTRIFVCVKDYKEVAQQLEKKGITDYSIYDKNKVYTGSGSYVVDTEKPYHIGYVAGAFDMFHIGHLNLLRRAKEMCDHLIVGVMSDQRIYDLKKSWPVIPCNERMQVVGSCRYVDQVAELPADRAGIMDAWERFHYDCMFSGDDHAENPDWLAERERLRERGSDIIFVSYTKDTSSSMIRNKVYSSVLGQDGR
ncbi:MAG: adenylyltransferase/cytidyltransferase family protein [Lachnospiraceae bacterium]|nr:adenylyltransferase/cytidyltransferase family protein [Lachnospiraceae bacterium]